MKKKLLPLVLGFVSLLYVSCSTETNTSTNNSDASAIHARNLSTQDFERAKELYVDMLATQEYLDFKNAISDFKLKLLSNQGLHFSNKAAWKNWVQNNLGLTSFTSVNEFEIMFDDAEHKFEVLRLENIVLYDYIRNADVFQLGQIFEPGFITPEQPIYEPNDCLDDCFGIWETGIYDNEQNYINNSNAALAESQWATAFIAHLDYEYTVNELYYQFNDCAGSC